MHKSNQTRLKTYASGFFIINIIKSLKFKFFYFSHTPFSRKKLSKCAQYLYFDIKCKVLVKHIILSIKDQFCFISRSLSDL